MRFESCLTNDYFKKINTVVSDICDVCNECVETVEHILLGCAKSILCCKILNTCTALNAVSYTHLTLPTKRIV